MAIKAVKEQQRGPGIKVVTLCRREIAVMADEYIARNPELLNDAATLVERWRTEGLFRKRAQAVRNVPRLAPPRVQSVQNLELMHAERRPGAQAV